MVVAIGLIALAGCTSVVKAHQPAAVTVPPAHMQTAHFQRLGMF